MRELLVAHADQLLGGAPEQRAQGGVHAHVLAVGVEQRHPERHLVERLVERSRLLAVDLAQQAQEPVVEHPHLTSSANGTPSARRPSSGTSGTSVPAVMPSSAAHSRAGQETRSPIADPTGSCWNIFAVGGLAATTDTARIELDGRLREQGKGCGHGASQ